MDKIESEDAPVIIAGFGRMGNMIGRFLEVNGVRTTVLDHNLDVVDVVRKLGLRACYGDAFRDMSKQWGDRKTFLEKMKGKIQEAESLPKEGGKTILQVDAAWDNAAFAERHERDHGRAGGAQGAMMVLGRPRHNGITLEVRPFPTGCKSCRP